MEPTLNKPHYQDPNKAREYLEAVRWPDGPVCPHCGVIGGHYALHGTAHRPGLHKCYCAKSLRLVQRAIGCSSPWNLRKKSQYDAEIPRKLMALRDLLDKTLNTCSIC